MLYFWQPQHEFFPPLAFLGRRAEPYLVYRPPAPAVKPRRKPAQASKRKARK